MNINFILVSIYIVDLTQIFMYFEVNFRVDKSVRNNSPHDEAGCSSVKKSSSADNFSNKIVIIFVKICITWMETT